MLRAMVLSAPLTGLLLASSGPSVAIAPAAPDASNIGFVLYTKSYAPGTLNARWLYAKTAMSAIE